MSITLPNDMADIIKTKVQSGEYARESEVIRDGVRALLARDRAIEAWLHHRVGSAYDALKADPSRAIWLTQSSTAPYLSPRQTCPGSRVWHAARGFRGAPGRTVRSGQRRPPDFLIRAGRC
jgi:antitoxin ParD1/3/4